MHRRTRIYQGAGHVASAAGVERVRSRRGGRVLPEGLLDRAGQAAPGLRQLRHRRAPAEARAHLRPRRTRVPQPPGGRGPLDRGPDRRHRPIGGRRAGRRDPGPRTPRGVELPSPGAGPAAPARLAAAGLANATEDEVSCCYAVQDKVWTDGPDGEPWEIYTVLDDVEMAPGELRTVDPADGM